MWVSRNICGQRPGRVFCNTRVHTCVRVRAYVGVARAVVGVKTPVFERRARGCILIDVRRALIVRDRESFDRRSRVDSPASCHKWPAGPIARIRTNGGCLLQSGTNRSSLLILPSVVVQRYKSRDVTLEFLSFLSSFFILFLSFFFFSEILHHVLK